MHMNESKEAFLEDIYCRYAHKLENICLQYTSYRPEYRDIVDDSIQKTFETATRQYKELQHSPYLEGWLCKTCMNRLRTELQTYRRRKKRQISFEAIENFQLSSDQLQQAVDDAINRINNRDLIQRIFSALNKREHDIAFRYFIQGESVSEIAQLNHVSIGAVKAVIARFRANARKIANENFYLFIIYSVSFSTLMRLKK